MRRRAAAAGFTLVETLIVLCIVALLVRIGIPAYENVRREAIAAQAAGDFDAVRAAAYAEFGATGAWPPAAAAGRAPAGLASYLPPRFSFEKRAYRLEWENFAVHDTAGAATVSGQVLAITVFPADSLVGRAIVRTLGANCTHWPMAGGHTFVVQSTLEAR